MYNGWTESQEQIEARKRRILAGYDIGRRTAGAVETTTQTEHTTEQTIDAQQGHMHVTLLSLHGE